MTDWARTTGTAAVALLASVAMIGSATAASNSTDYVYTGGSTMAAAVYRALMDTWNAPLVAGGCSRFIIGTDWAKSGFGLGEAAIFYAAAGSAAGKTAFINHNGGSVAGGLGVAEPVIPPPYTFAASCTSAAGWASLNGTGGYLSFHFAATEDVITADDIAAYNANGGPSKWGKLSQVPAMAVAVSIAYNGSQLDVPEFNSNPLADHLALTRRQICGIVSGHITNWADPIFSTARNNRGPLTTTSVPLTVVHARDAAGETLLLTQALKEQCAGIVGPNNAYTGDLTPSLWEMGWTDRSATTCPAIPSRGSSAVNWPDYGTDQCGNAIPNPGGGTFVTVATSGQAACAVALSPGAISFLSANISFANCPGAPSVVDAAWLQNQYSVDNDPPDGPYTYDDPFLRDSFVGPNSASVQLAMVETTPNFPTDAALTNPLNWSRQGANPNPLGHESYPIVGFTWIDLYQCYKQGTAAGNVLGRVEGFLQDLYGGVPLVVVDPAYVTNFFQFGAVPGPWSDAVASLLLNSSARLGAGGQGVCSGIPGA